MFDIFVKRKELVLDCFTDMPQAFELAKINHASKYIPDWWIQTPKECMIKNPNNVYETSLTIRSCVGLAEYYRKGIVIPSWTEIKFRLSSIHEKDRTIFIDPATKNVVVDLHPPQQFALFHRPEGMHIKMRSPWWIKTKRKVLFTFTQPTWNMRDTMFHLSILPGCMNFYDQNSTHINMFFYYSEYPKEFKIDALTPLAILHPMTEDKIVLKHHLVESREKHDIRPHDMFFSDRQTFSGYEKYKKARDKLLEKLERINSN